MLKIDIRNSQLNHKDFAEINSAVSKAIKHLIDNKGRGYFEFMNLPEDFKTAKEIEKYAKTLKYENIVLIGMGGAILGAKTIVESLSTTKTPRYIALDNIDPDFFTRAINKFDLSKSVFVVASKSGDTVETIANFMALKAVLEKRKINYKKNTIIITENNTALLNKIAKRDRIKCFHVSKNIGGRFSALGPMGLVAAALAGFDTQKILKGAKGILKEAGVLASVQFLSYAMQNKHITVLFPYSRNLDSFVSWYIQLLAESLGKTEKIGPTPIKAIGASDQHSKLQLLMQGPKDKMIIFIEVKNFKNKVHLYKKDLEKSELSYLQNVEMGKLMNTEKKAIAEALKHNKRPNITIKIDRLNEKNLGKLIYLFELQVALLGELFRINAFDQPGVELGKKLTKKYLSNAKN